MITYKNLLVTAGPLNTMLWRIVAMESDGNYYEGFYSLLDGSEKVTLTHHNSAPELLASFEENWSVARLHWFTKGFFKVWQDGTDLVMTDLRMGSEPSYVFSFVVGDLTREKVAVPTRHAGLKRDVGSLKKAWCRIWSVTDRCPS
jgi:inner membrane protein